MRYDYEQPEEIKKIYRKIGIRMWWIIMIGYIAFILASIVGIVRAHENKVIGLYIFLILWNSFWAYRLYRFGKKRGVIR